jgi:hypothetical protein
MRYLSFKIFLLCIIFPPVCYILTAYIAERTSQNYYTAQIEDIYTGDLQPLLMGNVRLKTVITQNIDNYLQTRSLIHLGLKVDVTIVTQKGNILYPDIIGNENLSSLPPDPMQVAADNYALLNEGLVVRVETKFEHNRLLSNSILGFYIFLSTLIFYLHYKAAVRKAALEERETRLEMDRLQAQDSENVAKLDQLVGARQDLQKELARLKKSMEDERIKAGRFESELFEEVETLEGKLQENISLQDTQQAEISELRDKIKKLEKGRQKIDKQKVKTMDATQKRLTTLYKNLSIHDRAISGFVDLEDEMKIKAEEVIHQLNEDPSLVTIKRKVFGRKGHKTVFEVVYAYKGRLYFRNLKNNQIEVLAIGTKNTQAKELEFLAGL